MSSEQFQATYERIYNIGTRLLQFLQEMQSGRLSEKDDTKGIQSIEDDINKALSALKEQKYRVAVVAAMNAGKSTFLNALIGADILATDAEACTVSHTYIRPIASGHTPQLLEYQQGQPKPLIFEGDSGTISRKLQERTRAIRETLKKGNSSNTTRFEIEHPIEAISRLSSLAGFTLVDTPGPNEWKSIALKQTTLEALRTCDAILFVLDYCSFQDNTNLELIQDLVEQRSEFLKKTTGKIYFILNKVDRKAEGNRSIEDVIADLSLALIDFGIPQPLIYPASAWQGLLAKLIKSKMATKEHLANFKNFFLAKYIEEDEDGVPHVPKFSDIAPKALVDSGIPTIENSIIQTVVQNSGWNLLSNTLAVFDKAAKDIENSFNIEIRCWAMQIETLKQKEEEFRRSSESAKTNVEAVKKTVEKQKQILIREFSQGISIFAESAKNKIQEEIDLIAQSRSIEPTKPKVQNTSQPSVQQTYNEVSVGGIVGEIGETILETIPVVGRSLGKIFKLGISLLDTLIDSVPDTFSDYNSPSSNQSKIYDPYKIRCINKEEADKTINTINKFCAPHIQSWWLDTQDKLIREGEKIREELAQKIQQDIQQISNVLSDKLGDDLQIELNYSPIQFPSFDFRGIDAEIDEQREVIERVERIQRVESRPCHKNNVYYVDIPMQEERSVFEVDLHKTVEAIKQKIAEQEDKSKKILKRVIEKQVAKDFRNAEKQINNYINRFQTEFNRLLRERESKGKESSQIRAILESQKSQLNEYLYELNSIRESLNTWEPAPTRR